jgi:predicted PurR-regulated permease PerM
LARLIEKTVRIVVSGVLGVAPIQSAREGFGFSMMGMPHTGFWTLAAVFLAFIQIGAGPTVIGAVMYAFFNNETFPAGLFLIWNVAVILSDNVL